MPLQLPVPRRRGQGTCAAGVWSAPFLQLQPGSPPAALLPGLLPPAPHQGKKFKSLWFLSIRIKMCSIPFSFWSLELSDTLRID